MLQGTFLRWDTSVSQEEAPARKLGQDWYREVSGIIGLQAGEDVNCFVMNGHEKGKLFQIQQAPSRVGCNDAGAAFADKR